MCTTVDNFFFHMGSRDQTWVQAKHFSNEVNCSSCLFYACLGTPDSSNSLTLASQVAGTIGMHHCSTPVLLGLNDHLLAAA